MRIDGRLILAVLGATIAMTLACMALAQLAAEQMGVQMSLHGWIALVLGVVATIGVAVLLVGLLIYSRQAGFDQDAHDMTETMMGRRADRGEDD